jgi:hypothetical protein
MSDPTSDPTVAAVPVTAFTMRSITAAQPLQQRQQLVQRSNPTQQLNVQLLNVQQTRPPVSSSTTTSTPRWVAPLNLHNPSNDPLKRSPRYVNCPPHTLTLQFGLGVDLTHRSEINLATTALATITIEELQFCAQSLIHAIRAELKL